MNIKINTKTERPMLSRTEVQGIIGFDKATPSRTELRKKIADSLKSKEELVIVKNISTAFGERKAGFSANIYDNAENLAKFEMKVAVDRNTKKKKAEKIAEAAPEAKVEKKEEKSKEPEKKVEEKAEKKEEPKEKAKESAEKK